MSIRKDVTVKITNNNATLDMPLQIYELDHGIELRFKLMDYKYKYTKDPQNILNSSDEDILEAYTTIINPRGYELQQINGEVKDDIVIFMIDSSYTDEIDEIGTYSLQIHIKCACSEFSIPPIQFEVLQRLKGIKVVTDGEDSIDDSALIDNYSNFISDETGKLLIEWKKGDIISSVKLNAMVEVINNAVDEEVQRQLNEVKREQQELERQNKVREALNSVDARVDEAMIEYETRFNALTVSQQQDMEVIDARDGEVSLKARLDRDLRNPLQVYEDVEGSFISCDSVEGYAQNVEILGNTIQDQNNLADIRSVGDKVENQELYEIPVLSCGKNLFCHPNTTLPSEISYDKETQIYTLNGTWNGHKKVYIGDMLEAKKGDSISVTVEVLGGSTTNNNGLIVGGYNERDGKTSWAGPSPYINTSDVKVYTNTQILVRDGCDFITFWVNLSATFNNFKIRVMFEKNSQATPYEPYQEEKLTILSPVQLEKVGDVADRIICKDGVWGVEKNINTVVLNGSEDWKYYTAGTQTTHKTFRTTLNGYTAKNKDNELPLDIMSSKFKISSFGDIYDLSDDLVGTRNTENYIYIKSTNQTIEDLKSWLKSNNTIIKYQLTQPTFIPLSHDQQVKLRTFANKTNISFGCEIEPTLKARIPKSLGATVNSHSEQIDNLSKELDKVKKLEESVASEVVTKSDFTTVTETSNGYFEDVKIEGRTLVNLANAYVTVGTGSGKAEYAFDGEYYSIQKTNEYTIGIAFKSRNDSLEANKTYTIIINNKSEIQTFLYDINYNKISNLSNGINIIKFTPSISQPIRVGDVNNNSSEGLIKFAIVLLEGDHTQNPPEYFEGIKSVGQDVDEISVESMEENIVKYTKKTVKSDGYACDFESISSNDVYYHNLSNKNIRLHIKKDDTYVKNIIIPPKTTIQHELSNGNVTYSVSLTLGFGWELQEYDIDRIFAITRKNLADKKHLLYYNPTTDTWEKPILREWDSIEKHSDGKYYYHKRSEEVVFNGEEQYDWYYYSYGGFGTDIPNLKRNISGSEITSYSISNSLTPVTYNELSSVGSGYYSVHYTVSRIVIKSDCATTEEFEDWLRSNPVIIVYQLETEEVYECTNIDLITYENETNFIVNTGAIAPVSTLKVMCNINNVVRELQQKVSNLENYIQHVMIDALNNALNK